MKGNYANHIGTTASVYMAAVLQYLCAKVLDLTKAETANAKKKRIVPRHIMLAIKKDYDLDQLLKNVLIPEAGVLATINPASLQIGDRTPSQEY